jgi:hypothetical protein
MSKLRIDNKMTSNTYAVNKTIEETAQEFGVAIGRSAKMACTAVKVFGEGIQKEIDENKPLEEKFGDAREALIKGIMESAEKVGKTAEAFGSGIKKGIDDAKPIKEKVEEAGEALVKVVAEGIDSIENGIEIEKDKIENN